MEFIFNGQFKEADSILTNILARFPDHSDALYGRAYIFFLAQRFDLAIGFAGKAIKLRAKSEYYTILGKALYCQGHWVEACSVFKSAITLNPSNDQAFNAIAKVLVDLKEYDQAEFNFKKAVELQKNEFEYWNDLIDFYWDQHLYELALTIAQKSVQANPGEKVYLFKLALVLQTLNLLEEAILIYKKIIHIFPQEYGIFANIGAILFQLNHLDEAKKYLEKALYYQKDKVETCVNLALVYMATGSLLKAKVILQENYNKFPLDFRIGLNLGTVLFELRELDEAENLYNTLIEDENFINLSEVEQCKFYYNLSSVLLAKGELKAGWKFMEARHVLLTEYVDFKEIPLWDGKVFHGNLLLRSEQGLGDIIQFIRYIPYIDERLFIFFEVPKAIYRLIILIIEQMELGKRCKIFCLGNKVQEFVQFQTKLMSLPYLLKINNIPLIQPILIENENDIQVSNDKLNVGICWSGNSNYRFDRIRSIPYDFFSDLLNIEKVKFYSLQPDYPEGVFLRKNIIPLPQGDLLDTAYLIQKLDLVITVDTVIAHLAGILGKKVWLLNRYGGDWRWYEGSNDRQGNNLWYPTITFFQQEKIIENEATWKPVINKVQKALKNYYF